jgi:hypothetical protein
MALKHKIAYIAAEWARVVAAEFGLHKRDI